jgi:broad specificity phosphatase PhoE
MPLILIRHTAVDVQPGTCYGQADVPLREPGGRPMAFQKRRI